MMSKKESLSNISNGESLHLVDILKASKSLPTSKFPICLSKPSTEMGKKVLHD